MNAKEFFEKYSIEEITQKTKISPITLRFIRNKEFDKIPRAKFFGFLKIIEKEFNVDLSDLKEEYNNFNPIQKEKPQEIKIEKNQNNNNYLIFFAFLLLLIGGYLLYKSIKPSKPTPTLTQQIIIPPSKNIEKSIENNTTENIFYTEEKNNTEQNTTKQETTLATNKILQKNNSPKKIDNATYKIIITPNEKVWFRAKNIDTNKTFEYLTSHEKILPKGNYYIKFGHGNVTINYANQTITPNTKKIIRILFKDGNYTYLKKPNRYEK